MVLAAPSPARDSWLVRASLLASFHDVPRRDSRRSTTLHEVPRRDSRHSTTLHEVPRRDSRHSTRCREGIDGTAPLLAPCKLGWCVIPISHLRADGVLSSGAYGFDGGDGEFVAPFVFRVTAVSADVLVGHVVSGREFT